VLREDQSSSQWRSVTFPGSLRLVLNFTRLKRRLLAADGGTVLFGTRKTVDRYFAVFCIHSNEIRSDGSSNGSIRPLSTSNGPTFTYLISLKWRNRPANQISSQRGANAVKLNCATPGASCDYTQVYVTVWPRSDVNEPPMTSAVTSGWGCIAVFAAWKALDRWKMSLLTIC